MTPKQVGCSLLWLSHCVLFKHCQKHQTKGVRNQQNLRSVTTYSGQEFPTIFLPSLSLHNKFVFCMLHFIATCHCLLMD